MSFALRLKAHYALAKTQYFSEQAALQAKTEQLLFVVGTRQPPITLEGLKDDFERAVKLGMPRAEAERLQAVLGHAGFRLVDDEARYVARYTRTAEQLRELIGELESPKAREQIKWLIPEELRAKLTEEQLGIVVSEVQRYGVEILGYFRAAVLKALHASQTAAQRSVGVAQVQTAIDAFEAMTETVMRPLTSFEP